MFFGRDLWSDVATFQEWRDAGLEERFINNMRASAETSWFFCRKDEMGKTKKSWKAYRDYQWSKKGRWQSKKPRRKVD